jgi:hypothetical protein
VPHGDVPTFGGAANLQVFPEQQQARLRAFSVGHDAARLWFIQGEAALAIT